MLYCFHMLDKHSVADSCCYSDQTDTVSVNLCCYDYLIYISLRGFKTDKIRLELSQYQFELGWSLMCSCIKTAIVIYAEFESLPHWMRSLSALLTGTGPRPNFTPPL